MSSIPGGDIVSTVGNGGLMTKNELLVYFLMCVRLQTDYEELETKICEKRERIDELRLLMKSISYRAVKRLRYMSGSGDKAAEYTLKHFEL